MKKIIKTAEQQLQEILDKYGIKNLEYAGDCVYYAVSETNQVIAVRKDSEDATNDENGIRIEIYPPYEKLRANKDVLELLRNDAIGNLDYQYFGKLVCWEKFGDADCRPHPVNLYYVEDVIRVVMRFILLTKKMKVRTVLNIKNATIICHHIDHLYNK